MAALDGNGAASGVDAAAVFGVVGIAGARAANLGTALQFAGAAFHIDTAAVAFGSSVAANVTAGERGRAVAHVEAAAVACVRRGAVALGRRAADETAAHSEVTAAHVHAAATVLGHVAADGGIVTADGDGAVAEIEAAAVVVGGGVRLHLGVGVGHRAVGHVDATARGGGRVARDVGGCVLDEELALVDIGACTIYGIIVNNGRAAFNRGNVSCVGDSDIETATVFICVVIADSAARNGKSASC